MGNLGDRSGVEIRGRSWAPSPNTLASAFDRPPRDMARRRPSPKADHHAFLHSGVPRGEVVQAAGEAVHEVLAALPTAVLHGLPRGEMRVRRPTIAVPVEGARKQPRPACFAKSLRYAGQDPFHIKGCAISRHASRCLNHPGQLRSKSPNPCRRVGRKVGRWWNSPEFGSNLANFETQFTEIAQTWPRIDQP